MLTNFFIKLKNIDWFLFVAVVFLIVIGFLGIYSVGLGQDNGNPNFYKQLGFFGLGLVLFFSLAFFNYSSFSNFSVYIYFICFIFLLLVLFFGREINGTKGWFAFGFLRFQPVELTKIGLMLFLSNYFSSVSININPLKYLLISLGASLALIAMVLAQPDLGSAFILFFIWIFMVFIADFPKKYLLTILALGVILFFVSWNFYLKDYQKERIFSFLTPASSSVKRDYNVRQAMIAIGAGGFFGRGFGFGTQSQLKFLPEAKTDFIFAVVAEELGFFGVFFVLFFFVLLFYRIFANLNKIKNEFAYFFCLCSFGLIFIEMFINIGMNMGILPVIGIALPFLSYGGSSLVSNMIIMGIVEGIIVKSKK